VPVGELLIGVADTENRLLVESASGDLQCQWQGVCVEAHRHSERRVPGDVPVRGVHRTLSLTGVVVREVLDAVFAGDDVARSYVLDDQSALRKHMNIFVDGHRVRDRAGLSDPVPENAEIFIIQALSGG
jgi:hypothetical protein